MSEIAVSIVVASYNRAELLDETLLSLEQELMSDQSIGPVHVVMVNNNSSDRTHEVMAGYAGRNDLWEVINEFKQGLSYARNAGVQHSRGRFVAFLDDDVELEKGWLSALIQQFDDPSVAVVGGRVVAFGQAMLPDWLPREYGYLVSVFDPSDKIVEVKSVLGASFVVRKAALKSETPFNVNLGRKGRKLLGGEEVELFDRIRRDGGRVIYTPFSTVQHKIADKVTRNYVADYAYWLGVSEAVIDKKAYAGLKFFGKYVRSVFFPIIVYPIKLAICRRKEVELVRLTIKGNYARGYIRSSVEVGDSGDRIES